MSVNKSLLKSDNFRKTVLLECTYECQQKYVSLDNDCSIRVYQSFITKMFLIMLALCLMLSVTYYAQNCTGIID